MDINRKHAHIKNTTGKEREKKGYALLQKTFTEDVLTKRRIENDGSVPQYYVENSHEAIISKELYHEVQAEMARRSAMKDSNEYRRGYCSIYALTGYWSAAVAGRLSAGLSGTPETERKSRYGDAGTG